MIRQEGVSALLLRLPPPFQDYSIFKCCVFSEFISFVVSSRFCSQELLYQLRNWAVSVLLNSLGFSAQELALQWVIKVRGARLSPQWAALMTFTWKESRLARRSSVLKLCVDKKAGKWTNPICASPLVQDVHYRLETFMEKVVRLYFIKSSFVYLKSVNLMQDLGKSRIGSWELFHLLVSDAPADVSRVSVVS